MFSHENKPFCVSHGGDKRDRTADLLNAIQALSQLSYTPIKNRRSRMISLNARVIIAELTEKVNPIFSFFATCRIESPNWPFPFYKVNRASGAGARSAAEKIMPRPQCRMSVLCLYKKVGASDTTLAPIWRSGRDSNPRAVLPTTRFPIVLVMTTSIPLQVGHTVSFLHFSATAWTIIPVFFRLSRGNFQPGQKIRLGRPYRFERWAGSLLKVSFPPVRFTASAGSPFSAER